jgi:hypothetical protein
LDQAPTLTETGTKADDPQHGEDDDLDELASQDDAVTNTADRHAETDDTWRQRVADLESGNTDLGKAVAELESENADLGKTVAALEARLEQLEQGNSDSRTGDAVIDNRTHGGFDEDSARPEHEQKRRLPSDEALLFGAAGIGGALTAASYYLSSIRPDVAGITASTLAAGAAGVAWIHKRREARHADRSED